MSDDEKKLLLEELKLCNDDYKYRDQLLVTEFALSITAFGVGLNAANGAQDWTKLLIYLGLALFLSLVAHHSGRVNQDRLAAGDRSNEIKKKLELVQTHGGYAKKRGGIRIPAPKAMVWFVWLSAASSALLALVQLRSQLGA